MHVVVGLGNPGSPYEGTRHNIGFDVVDAAAAALGVRFRSGAGNFLHALASEAVLVKPLTYMNNSGIAVAEALGRLGLPERKLLVVVDDLWLPLAALRIREKGSAGGHNGLRSIIETLGTTEFPRLRFGIGKNPDPHRQADYVLSPFDPEEREAVRSGIARAKDAVLTVIDTGVDSAAQTFNRQST